MKPPAPVTRTVDCCPTGPPRGLSEMLVHLERDEHLESYLAWRLASAKVGSRMPLARSDHGAGVPDPRHQPSTDPPQPDRRQPPPGQPAEHGAVDPVAGHRSRRRHGREREEVRLRLRREVQQGEQARADHRAVDDAWALVGWLSGIVATIIYDELPLSQHQDGL